MRSLLKIIVGVISLGMASPTLAAAPACTGNVVIGEGGGRIVTHVANRAVDGVCLNDQIVDTDAEGANYGNHGEFVLHLGKLVADWTKSRQINLRDAAELLAAWARSEIGKTINVRVIAFNDFHGNLQSPGTFGVQAGGPGTATVNQPAGGIEYMAGYVAAQKAGHPNNVIVSAATSLAQAR